MTYSTTIYPPDSALRRDTSVLGDCDLQYRTIVESTFDSIITVNESAVVVEANAAATRTFGGSAADFLGRTIDELFVRVVDDAVLGQNQLGRLLAADEVWPHGAIQVVAQGLNGRQFLAELTAVRTRYGDKSIHIIFVREVTERVLARKALRESEEKYCDLFDQMLEGVIRSLGDGSILAANPAMVRMLGYASEEELCGATNARDLFSFPGQHKSLMTNLGEDGAARGLVIEVRCKDRSRRTLLANMKAIPGQAGEDTIYLGTFSDVGEIQRTTYALRDSERHFRAMAENTPDIVTIITAEGQTLYSSPSVQRITGYSANLRTGRCIFENVIAEDAEVVKRAIGDAFENLGTPKWFDFRYRHQDGSILYMESVGTAFLNSKGELRAVVNTRDRSQRHRTNQQLQQAQKMQAVGQLTGGIAHDFNNLLTIIVGNLQLIEEAAVNPEVDQLAETAFRAAMQGADLTHRLLAFAKRQPLEPKVIDVDGLLRGMEPLLRRSLGKPMSIVLEAAEHLWLAKVDPAQLESAILNLAINARDAMGNHGQLTISSSNCDINTASVAADASLPLGEFIRVSVSDNGSGMTEEVRKSAIEPFFSTKNNSDGSGLGLSMVYGFVQQSGGHMRLDSKSGKGTCVSLYLPRSSEYESAAVRSDKVVADACGDQTVLVVDDNNDVRKSVAAVVSNIGYRVLEASDGNEALRVMESSHVDVLFSDIRMPGMSGFELATTTRKRHPQIRTMLTSGFTDGPTDPSGDELGRYAFLPKPYSKYELATRLRAVSENSNEKQR